MLPTHRIIIIAVASVVVLFLFFHSYSDNVPSLKSITKLPNTPFTPSLSNAIHTLFESIRQPITEFYTDPAGKVYVFEGKPVWDKPLGKKILIVDIDTRVPDGKNEILNKNRMDWENMGISGGGQLVSNGIMDHYMYAQIHGYDYKFFQAQHVDGYYDTWISPHVLRKLLPDYQFVVTMDADVTVTHPEVGLEWLFNHWGIKANTSIAMPWDQKEMRGNDTISTDSQGVLVLNTGFVLVQNNPLSMEMLEAWRDCPTEKRYKGCAHWKENWSHEQRAFSEYIRYDFNPDGDNIVPIPCDDAMGWPGMTQEYEGRISSDSDCNGNFFRHHTLNKQKPKESVSASFMQLLLQSVQKSIQENRDNLWIVESKNEALGTENDTPPLVE